MHTMNKLSLVASLVVSLFSFSAWAGEPLKLFPGWPASLGAADSAASADPSVATVAVSKDGVKVTGKKAGRTTVTLERGGASEAVTVEVETAGWKMVPLVVAAHDIPEGTRVTNADLEQREVPEFLVTTSLVKANAVGYILKQKLLVPVQAGDFMVWSAFQSPKVK